MRIAVLARSYPATSETFVRDQVEQMRADGHEVDVYAVYGAAEGDTSNGTNPTACAMRGSANSSALVMAALKGLTRLMLRPSAWIMWFKLAIRLRHRLVLPLALLGIMPSTRLSNCDLMLCHFGPVGLWGAGIRAAIAPQVLQATVFHGIDVSAVVRQFGVDFYRPMFCSSHLSIAIASTWLPVLAILGDPQAIHIRLGVDLNTFTFRARQLPLNDPIRLISVGRLVPKKGHDIVLKALARLPRPLRWHYDIVGDGPTRSTLDTIVRDANLNANVTFHGAQSHSRCRELLDIADVFALPSRTAADGDMEGVPVALMEAMASGMPVISSRHSGIVDLIEDGTEGFLVREGNDRQFQQVLEILEGSQGVWPAITSAAYKKVSSLYVTQANTRLLIAELESWLSTQAPHVDGANC